MKYTCIFVKIKLFLDSKIKNNVNYTDYSLI